MARLGRALVAKPETLMGLAGLGDLILTGTPESSRNYAYGLGVRARRKAGRRLGRGSCNLYRAGDSADRHGLDLPVLASVAAVIDRRMTIEEAVENCCPALSGTRASSLSHHTWSAAGQLPQGSRLSPFSCRRTR